MVNSIRDTSYQTGRQLAALQSSNRGCDIDPLTLWLPNTMDTGCNVGARYNVVLINIVLDKCERILFITQFHRSRCLDLRVINVKGKS